MLFHGQDSEEREEKKPTLNWLLPFLPPFLLALLKSNLFGCRQGEKLFTQLPH
jgi:hypothetical protein